MPNLVLIGVPDVTALERVKEKLEKGGIPHFNWVEPDFNFGFTAIATAPLMGEKRSLLSNYQVWSHSSGTEKSVCHLTVDGGANTSVAQLQSNRL